MSALLKFVIGPIAGPAFLALAVVFFIGNAVQWGVWSWRVSIVESDRDAYKKQIEDVNGGLVRQVTQCLTNTEGLSAGLESARGDIAALAKATEDNDKRTRDAIAAANKNAKGAFDNASKLLARPTVAMPGTLESCQRGEAILRGRLP